MYWLNTKFNPSLHLTPRAMRPLVSGEPAVSSANREVSILIRCQIHFVTILHFASLLILPSLLTNAPARADNEVPFNFLQKVPVTIDGESIYLQMRIYKPAKAGKHPTLVLNHGSTGTGMVSDRFKRPVDMPAVASFFVMRGWAVVIPARRGRAGSDGNYRPPRRES